MLDERGGPAVEPDERVDDGLHSVEVETGGLAAGVYAYRLRLGDREVSRRMTVVR